MAPTDRLCKLVTAVAEQAAGCTYPVLAPAKVNLRLSVRGRRPDGYHLLDMVNCTIGLADELALALHVDPQVRLVVEPSQAVDGDVASNLSVRAFVAFFRELGFATPPVGFSCHLTKKIPVGAGLGGGSSDAAAVLRWLSGLFGDAVREVGHDLASVIERAALSCGADVPFFLLRGLCHVTGIGEIVEPLDMDTVDNGSLLVVAPKAFVNTKEFYAFYRLRMPNVLPKPLPALPVKPICFEQLKAVVGNNFEPHVCEMAPEVERVLSIVRESFPIGSAVTGSGAALFALVSRGELATAQALREPLERLGARVFLTELKV